MSVHFFREKFPQTADLKHIKETVTKSKPDVLMSIRISIRTLISIYQTHLNDKHVAIQSNSNTHPLHCSTDFPILKMKARAQLKLGVFGIHSYLVVYISCDKNLLHKTMIIKVSLILVISSFKISEILLEKKSCQQCMYQEP